METGVSCVVGLRPPLDPSEVMSLLVSYVLCKMSRHALQYPTLRHLPCTALACVRLGNGPWVQLEGGWRLSETRGSLSRSAAAAG